MRRTARVLAGLLAVVTAASLSACVAPTQLVAGSHVTIVTDGEVEGLNPGSALGAAAARLGVDVPLYAGFAELDDEGEPVPDLSFGAITVVDEAPLTVRYTVADATRWSDGTPLDAVDLLLDWAAHADRWRGFTSVGDNGASAVAQLPTLSADRKSLTVVYEDGASVDPLRQFSAVMPAHVVAEHALGVVEPEPAKDAVIATIDAAIAGDDADIVRLARFWTSRFTVQASPDVLVVSGPYRIGEVREGFVELRPNPQYSGDRRPQLESVRIVTMPALDGLQALTAGVADVLAVTPSELVGELAPSLGLRVLTSGEWINTLVVLQRQTVDGVEVGDDGRRLLWNLADWVSVR